MWLYYVYTDDKSFGVVVYAGCSGDARFKAKLWLKNEFGVDISMCDLYVDSCDNDVIV